MLLISVCNDDKIEDSQERELIAIEVSQEIQNGKYREAADTFVDGHPIDTSY